MLLIIPNPAFFCIDTASGECYNRLSIDFCDEWAKTALNGAQRVCIRCEQMSAFGYPAHEHGKVKCIEPFAACSVPQFSAQKCVTTFEAEWLPFREIRWYSA